MKNQIKILFTSVGRRVELLQTFKKASEKLKIDIRIYGSDFSTTAPALCFCDERLKVCRINDKNYIPELLKICDQNHIDILIPTIDTDLLILAEEIEMFQKINTKVLVSAEDKIRICRDKRKTASFFRECGLLSPITVDDVEKYNSYFPCFIKPLDGSSSINAFKAENVDDLHMYACKIDKYIIQPFIEGTEYTVDIMCDFDGNPIYITPRERIEVRSGEVIKTQISNDNKIIEECKSLITTFKPYGPITVQLIRQKSTGDDYYIEINPRFGGGAPLSMHAGANSAELIIRLLTGEHVDMDLKLARNDLIYCRYDQSICINEVNDKNYLKQYKAIIFDLDDTLYSEKEYVKSGFQAVSYIIPDVENACQKLWDAFLNGEQAIDFILKSEGIYSEELKKKSMDIYRFHKPEIYLYEGVIETLTYLRKIGIKLGIITDGRSEGQNAKIEALGLRQLFDEIIITDELGGTQFRKPNDISFRIMQNRLNVPFENMVYIGDNLNKDFTAPIKLGMDSIYFKNNDGLYLQETVPVNGCRVIYSINQILESL